MKPYTIYGDVTCGKTLAQFMDAMKQDYVVKGTLMPDSHLGYSLPIGSAIMTKDAVVPAWVGYDIGCGVTVWRTGLKVGDIQGKEQLIYDDMKNLIPTGYNLHEEAESSQFLDHKVRLSSEYVQSIYKEATSKCIGTLGGGNHFIEIGSDEDGYICITIHSGSRGFGHKVASYHMAKAANSDKAVEGHYAYTDSDDIATYLKDVRFATWVAQLNRYRMGNTVDMILAKHCGAHIRNVVVNCVHNSVSNSGFGTYIHRKGTTEVKKDCLVAIPANMKDGVFLVKGLGGRDNLDSCSHGCGRVLSRKQAKEQITNEDFAKDMAGVICNTSGKTDEAPAAYKNIYDVLEAQEELVDAVNYISPIINLKG